MWGWPHYLRPASFYVAGLILWDRPNEAHFIIWGQPWHARLALFCEAGIILWGWPHPIRLASSSEPGPILWGWPPPLRLASSCDAGLIYPKFIEDNQHFSLATEAWPQTVGCAVMYFMLAWSVLHFFTLFYRLNCPGIIALTPLGWSRLGKNLCLWTLKFWEYRYGGKTHLNDDKF